jgi:predicted oxidoreductase
MMNINTSSSRIQLSDIVLGLWRLNDISGKETASIINYAIDLGINSVDEADIYGGYKSQTYLGRALREDKELRSKIQIISKAGIILPNSDFSKSSIGYYDTSEEHIIRSVEQTLKDLGTDYLDLLLIHRPDFLMHPQALDATFQKLKKQGKVLHFGVSNFTASQFEMLSQTMETPLETNQVEFSVLNVNALNNGIFDQCIKNSMSPMIWSPLGGGALFSNQDDKTQALRKVLTEIGEELGGVSIDKVALAWIMKHPANPSTVVGTLKPERIKIATEALSLKLSQEQWYRILIVAQGHSMD